VKTGFEERSRGKRGGECNGVITQLTFSRQESERRNSHSGGMRNEFTVSALMTMPLMHWKSVETEEWGKKTKRGGRGMRKTSFWKKLISEKCALADGKGSEGPGGKKESEEHSIC